MVTLVVHSLIGTLAISIDMDTIKVSIALLANKVPTILIYHSNIMQQIT